MVIQVEIYGCTGKEPNLVGVHNPMAASMMSIRAQGTLTRRLTNVFGMRKSVSSFDMGSLNKALPPAKSRNLTTPPTMGTFIGASDVLLSTFENDEVEYQMEKFYKNKKECGYFDQTHVIIAEDNVVFQVSV